MNFLEMFQKKEKKISKKFDKAIAKHKEALVNKEKVMSEFVKNFKEETDPVKKEKIKKEHVKQMEKINDNIIDLGLDYNTALQKMDVSYEEE